jgi:hypothetical protein
MLVWVESVGGNTYLMGVVVGTVVVKKYYYCKFQRIQFVLTSDDL